MFPVLLGVWDEHSWLRSRESAELNDTLTAMTANEGCESLFFLPSIGTTWFGFFFCQISQLYILDLLSILFLNVFDETQALRKFIHQSIS